MELKKLEEDMPSLLEKDLEKAVKNYNATTGVVCDGFSSQSSVGFDERNKMRSGGIVGESGNSVGDGRSKTWTTRFFSLPKNVTSERPIALVLTMIRWCEALRAPVVAKKATNISF